MSSLISKLLKIQIELKAPKNQYNSFGKYNYRSCEDILEGVKPLLESTKTALIISDEMVQLGDRYYVKATATIYDTESDEKISNSAYARESYDKKGMDESQITGCASSYARKYALNGLLCIDDTKDADTMDNSSNGKFTCERCGKEFKGFEWNGRHYTSKEAYEISKNKCNGKALCNDCKRAGF